MSRPQQLPAELISEIVNIIPSDDRPTLRTLALTSKVFNSAATCLLYRTMTDDKPESHYLFCKLLSLTPQLAELVREYHLPDRPWQDSADDSDIGRKVQLWGYMARSLMNMTNLKILLIPPLFPKNVIDILPLVDSQSESQSTLSAPLFQLEKLTWRSRLFRWDDERGSQAVQSFLDSQKNLKYLHWGAGKAPLDITLPKSLTGIGGQSHFLLRTLPKIPSIHRVHWDTFVTTYSTADDDEDPQTYSQELLRLDEFRRRVQVLRLSGGNESGYLFGMHKLRVIVDLQVLVYTTYLPLKYTYLLQYFPRLSELIIRAGTPFSTDSLKAPRVSFTMIQEWVDALFDQRKSVVSVYVRWGGECYRRWYKGELLQGSFLLDKETLLEY